MIIDLRRAAGNFAAVAALFTCTLGTAIGQSGTLKFKDFGSGFYVNTGIYASNNATRYDKLAALEVNRLPGGGPKVTVPKPSTSLIAIGIGGYGVSSGITYGGEVNGYIQGATKSNLTDNSTATTANPTGKYELAATPFGVDIMAMVGAILVREKGFVLHPQLGIGYGGMAMRIADGRSKNRNYPVYALDFDDKENVVVWNANLVLDAGLNIDYYFNADKDRARGFKLGIKVGYRAQLASNNVRVNGSTADADPEAVTAGDYKTYTTPSLGSGGPYIKLCIGVGGTGLSKK